VALARTVVLQVPDLVENHVPSRKPGPNLELASQGFDKAPQAGKAHVGASLEAGDGGLAHAELLRYLLLSQVQRLPEGVRRISAARRSMRAHCSGDIPWRSWENSPAMTEVFLMCNPQAELRDPE
jgi:hypothetical protein